MATVKLQDNFNRADTSGGLGAAQVGGTWTADDTAVWDVKTNRAGVTTHDANNKDNVYLDAGTADGILTIDTPVAALVGQSETLRIVFRYSNINNFYLVDMDTSAMILYKCDAGAFTSLGSAGVGNANDDTLVVDLSGSAIKFKQNGTQKISITNTFNLNATKMGMGHTSGTVNGRFDNFLFEGTGGGLTTLFVGG